MSLSSIAIWFLWAALCYEAVLIAVIVLTWRFEEEERPEPSRIKYWLYCLLRNGYDGESVLFRDKRNRRFIRFQKYTDIGAGAGVELTFPEIGWGEEFLPELKAYCERKGLAFTASESDGAGYAHVRLGNDVDQAYALCHMIWTKFYGFLEHDKYVCHKGDLSTIQELVDNITELYPKVGDGMR